LGEVAQQSVIVLPTRSIATTQELDLGGRVLSLRAWPTAHTDTDVTVFDDASQTLWLGDLLFVDHIPVLDGNLRGFLSAIADLKTVRASAVRAMVERSAGRQRSCLKSATSSNSCSTCANDPSSVLLPRLSDGRWRAKTMALVR
jgi:hypothetical protein